MTYRPHNGRMRSQHSLAGSVAVGVLLVVVAFIGLLMAGGFQ